MNRPHRLSRLRRAAASIAVLALFAGCADDGTTPADDAIAPADDGGAVAATLLDVVPEPGEPQPVGTVEFAGPSEGGPNVALLADADGEVVVYACDGETYGELFEGSLADGQTELELAGADGGTVRIDLSADLPTGVLELAGGATHAFTLSPAGGLHQVAGFYRRVDGDVASAWVVTPNGSIRGVEKEGKEVTSGIDETVPGDEVVGDPSETPPPEDEVEPNLFFNKLRCKNAIKRHAATLPSFFSPESPEEFDAAQETIDAELEIINRIPGCRATFDASFS